MVLALRRAHPLLRQNQSRSRLQSQRLTGRNWKGPLVFERAWFKTSEAITTANKFLTDSHMLEAQLHAAPPGKVTLARILAMRFCAFNFSPVSLFVNFKPRSAAYKTALLDDLKQDSDELSKRKEEAVKSLASSKEVSGFASEQTAPCHIRVMSSRHALLCRRPRPWTKRWPPSRRLRIP